MSKVTSDMTTAKPTSLSRRRAIAGLGLGAAATLAAPAIAQNTLVLRMGTSWPDALGGLGPSARRVAERLTRVSDGRITVEFHPGGSLVGALAVHDAIGNGEIELYHSAEYYFQGKHRGFNFFTSVPLGLTSPEQIAWVKYGGGQALWDELNAPFGVKSFCCGATDVQMGGWFQNEIHSTDDFANLTMRIPGLGGQVLQELGAETIVTSAAGIVEAFFAGTINATEWVGPYNDLHFGFQKLLSTYVYPGFHEPGTVAALGISLNVWNELSPQDQALIQSVADAENVLHLADYYANNGLALRQLLNEFGVKPYRLPDDVWDAIAAKSVEVVAGVANDDDLARRIYESYDTFRTAMIGGASVSQADYLARRGMLAVFE